jgi:hypothetical protein
MEATRDDLVAIGVDISEIEVKLSRLEKGQTGTVDARYVSLGFLPPKQL